MIFRHMRAWALVLAAVALFGGAEAAEKLRFVMVTHRRGDRSPSGRRSRRALTRRERVRRHRRLSRPETFDLAKMTEPVDAAVKEKPDGLIVSIPNADAVAAPIRAAVDPGIPVITIPASTCRARSAHPHACRAERSNEAGRVVGDTMRKLGGSKAICINHELGNVGLDSAARAFIDGFAGSVEVMPVDPDPKKAGDAIAKKSRGYRHRRGAGAQRHHRRRACCCCSRGATEPAEGAHRQF